MKSNEEIINSSLSLIESWVADGSTDKEIAEKLGMSYSTFRRYKTENADLKRAIAQGKDKKNDNVVQALYKCCIGYKYYEEVATKVKTETRSPDGTVTIEEVVVVKPVKKYKGPDLNAQKFWLVNRNTKAWAEDPNKVLNDKKITKLKEKEVNAKVIEI